jgi:hypothetical protein
VSREEKRRIIKYCTDHKMTISEFLAALMLREARFTGKSAQREITIKLPYQEHAKIEYLANAQGITVADFLADLVRPAMAKQKAWYTNKQYLLRYYLSNEEHELVIKYLTKHKLSARYFVGLLAVRHVNHVAGGGRETRNYPWNKKA